MTTAEEYLEKGKKAYDEWDDEKALEYYSKAIELDPNYLEAYKCRCFFYEKKERYEEALNDCNKIIELEPNNCTNYFTRGRIYNEIGESDKAISDFQKMSEFGNGNDNIRQLAEFGMASVNEPTNDGFVLGGADFEYDDFQKYWSKGYSCFEEGNYEGVVENYTKVIKLQPENCEAYYFRGYAYKALEQYYDAINDFTKHLNINPYDAEVYFLKAVCEKKVKKYQSAIYDFARAIDIYKEKGENENLQNSYHNRADCYINLKQYEMAIEDLSKVINMGSDSDVVYFDRGNCYYSLKQYGKAIADFSEAIELNDEFISAIFNRALCYYETNQYRKAVADFDAVIRLKDMYPEHSDILQNAKQLREEVIQEMNEGDYEDDVEDLYDESDDYNADIFNECFRNGLKYFLEREITKYSLEFFKAYLIDKDMYMSIANSFIAKEPLMEKLFVAPLQLFEFIDNLDISDEEKMKHLVKVIEDNEQNGGDIDFSKLHYNPKQGRKLDL